SVPLLLLPEASAVVVPLPSFRPYVATAEVCANAAGTIRKASNTTNVLTTHNSRLEGTDQPQIYEAMGPDFQHSSRIFCAGGYYNITGMHSSRQDFGALKTRERDELTFVIRRERRRSERICTTRLNCCTP